MRPARRPIYASLAVFASMLLAQRTHADKLTLTSDPPGATVEIDGIVAGKTPLQTTFPGSYFHKTHSVFTARLEHSLVAHVFKDGYLPQQITLTDGPFEWTAVTGRRRGIYFLLKSDHFDVKLQEWAYDKDLSLEPSSKVGPIQPATDGFSPPATVNASAKPATVSISSDPENCEIFIDRKFVGQTPSTISLNAGAHHIEVRMARGNAWERNLDVSPDSQITLRAVLAPE